MEGIRPDRTEFTKWFEWFLSDLPDENCAKAGRAAYYDVSESKVTVNRAGIKDPFFPLSYRRCLMSTMKMPS